MTHSGHDSDADSFHDAEEAFQAAGDIEDSSSHGLLTSPVVSPPAGDARVETSKEASAVGPSAGDESADLMVSSRSPDVTAIIEPQEPYPLHRAAWYGQVGLIKRLVADMTEDQLKAYDSQGNTALHVAVMRRQAGAVEALLAARCPPACRNGRGWPPIMEAAELGDRDMALRLARAEMAHVREASRAKKRALLELLRAQLPDCSLQLRWEVGSAMPGIGALLRRFAPHDTYTIWKKGGRIRVDGTLMGVQDEEAGLWKRGAFSLLYDATGDKGRGVFVNHTKKEYLDVKGVRQKIGAEDLLEDEVDMLMTSEVLQRKKLRSVDFRFKPVAGWLTREVREKVEGWSCKLYEAGGRVISVSSYKMPWGLAPGTAFDDYLAASYEPDPAVEAPVNPFNPMTLKGSTMNPAKAAAKAAVAAKHQRIARAAAAAQDGQAAAVATAAAARAAAGARRALAPRIDEEDEEEGGGEGKGLPEDLGAEVNGGEGLGGEEGEGEAEEESEEDARARREAEAEAQAALAQRDGEDLTAWAERVAAEAAAANGRPGTPDGGGRSSNGNGGGSRGGSSAHGGAPASGKGAGGGGGLGWGRVRGSSGSLGAASRASPSPSRPADDTAQNAKQSRFGGWGFGRKQPSPPPAEPPGGGGEGGGGGDSASASAAARKSRKMTGRCWMAEEFPLSLTQLLPLLEVVGTANKALAKVARFMRKYGNMDMFPVKIQIPLLLTVYVLLSFKQFTLLGGGGPGAAPLPPDEFFELPAGYKQAKLEEKSAKPRAARPSKAGEGRQEGGSGSGDGAGAAAAGGLTDGAQAAEGPPSANEEAGAEADADAVLADIFAGSEAKGRGRKGKKGKRAVGKDEEPRLRLLGMDDDDVGLGDDD